MLKLIKAIFFGNYFIGLLALALSVESCVQLHLPLNSFIYYIILFCATVFYYTYAYLGPLGTGQYKNPRKAWYAQHHKKILLSQYILAIACIVFACIFLYKNFASIITLPFEYWLIVFVMLSAGFFLLRIIAKICLFH